VIAVVNTVISLYYYLRVIAPAILERTPDAPQTAAVGASLPLGVALSVSALATVAFGVAAEPLLRVAERATVLAGG
jgi:NADH-quinone oxidoreductase subunit N